MPLESLVLKNGGKLFEFVRLVINTMLGEGADADKFLGHALSDKGKILDVANILMGRAKAITRLSYDSHMIEMIEGKFVAVTIVTETHRRKYSLGDPVIVRKGDMARYGTAGWVVRIDLTDGNPAILPQLYAVFQDHSMNDRYEIPISYDDIERAPFHKGAQVRPKQLPVKRAGELFDTITKPLMSIPEVVDIYPFRGQWLMDLKFVDDIMPDGPVIRGFRASDFQF